MSITSYIGNAIGSYLFHSATTTATAAASSWASQLFTMSPLLLMIIGILLIAFSGAAKNLMILIGVALIVIAGLAFFGINVLSGL